jgi:hypothetical protein
MVVEEDRVELELLRPCCVCRTNPVTPLILQTHPRITSDEPLWFCLAVMKILEQGHKAVSVVLGERIVVVMREVATGFPAQIRKKIFDGNRKDSLHADGKTITKRNFVSVMSVKTRCPQSLYRNVK